MFWDRVAVIYDLFAEGVNRRTHRELKRAVTDLIAPGDAVLECACGTGMLTEKIAGICACLRATDFSEGMLERARKKCAGFSHVSFEKEDITALSEEDESYDKVVAANVIHLLEDPQKALEELNRVCRPGGLLIIPTYMNRDREGRTSGFARAVGKAGADFKRQFTPESYLRFFQEAGYGDARLVLIEGRIPCAVAVMKRKEPAGQQKEEEERGNAQDDQGRV